MKAIFITKTNRDFLASRYRVNEEDLDLRLPLGYYLVADFGNEDNYDLLSESIFNSMFIKTGEIDNGWSSIASL